jgi:hypothetical protein
MLNAPVPANATPLPAVQPFDRAAIMRAAHFTAKWRVATVGGSYRAWFAQALRHEWQKARADRLRRESNVGLPVRSCLADRTPRLLTRATGRLAHSFAA